jgi:hypothetical protein
VNGKYSINPKDMPFIRQTDERMNAGKKETVPHKMEEKPLHGLDNPFFPHFSEENAKNVVNKLKDNGCDGSKIHPSAKPLNEEANLDVRNKKDPTKNIGTLPPQSDFKA